MSQPKPPSAPFAPAVASASADDAWIQAYQEAQRKLSELQTKKSADQRMILSAEQQEEIKKFREVQVDARKELKAVQKSLSEDIDRLGVKVKVLNIAGVPLLVGIFGLLIGLRRRNQSSRPV